MNIETFELGSLPRGQKTGTSLEITAREHSVSLPLLVVRGARPGRTLVASAGVHGDEYEGIRAIIDVCRELNPSELSGDFIGLTVANPPAFWNATRTSPLDGGNLARVFPGAADGDPTAAIAFHIDRCILPLADFYLDLHSGGTSCLMPTLVGYYEHDAAARAAAQRFGMPIVWSHPAIAPGRTISAAVARGIPALYTEARGGARIDEGDLELYRRGIRNLLRHLEIFRGEFEGAPPELVLYGDGNIDSSVSCAQRGFLIPQVKLLQKVNRGQALGTVVDLCGNAVEEIMSPRDGVIVLIHARPMVTPDEPLFLVTGVQE